MDYYAGFSAYEAVGSVVGFLIATLVSAFSLTHATNFIASFKPSYRVALKGWILCLLASFVAAFSVGIVMGFFAIGSLYSQQLVGIAIGTAASSYVLGIVLKHPDTGPIGLKRGFLVVLTTYFINILLLVGFLLVAFVFAHLFDF